jgi:hypothetical protein
MPTYTVHEPLPRKGEATTAPERFVFVRDGFYFWAFLLAPIWLLWRRLWLAFSLYLITNVVLGTVLVLIGAPSDVKFLANLLIALLIGFEAPTLRRRKLAWRRWKMLGFVVGEDAEIAERRFYAEWAGQRNKQAAEVQAPSPQYSAPVRRGPPSPLDVIGLFPEPGGQR